MRNNKWNVGGVVINMSELISFTNLERVLEEYAVAARNTLQDKYINKDHIASGELLNTLEYQIDKGTTSISVSLKLQDYWKYLEEGTKPHWPPVSKMLEYVKVKPVLPSKTYNGKLPTEEQLAYLIGRKIAREGTEGTHALKETLAEVNAKYESLIGEAIYKDLDNAVMAILLEFRGKA